MKSTRKHILVVDDEEHIRTSISYILEDAGYYVTAVENGVEALATIQSQTASPLPVDLLLTDVQMPEMNGLELVDQLNEKEVQLPVIVITGYGDKETIVEFMRRGCIDYIDKPLLPDTVLKRTSEALANAERVQAINAESKKQSEASESRLRKELEHYQKNFQLLRNEVDSASDVYHKLVASDARDCAINVAVRNRPLRDCGGDFFDYRNTPCGCDFFMADVAGHDLAASYHTILLKAFFDENCRRGHKGPELLQLLNEQLRESGNNERIVSGIFFRVNLDMMIGEVVSAGHPYPVRQRPSLLPPAPIMVRGDVLGVHKHVEFERRTFPIAPGERFFLFTDGLPGVSQIDGPTGNKAKLGGAGVDDLIAAQSKVPLEEAVENVWKEALEFCHQVPSDDMMLVGFEIPKDLKARRTRVR